MYSVLNFCQICYLYFLFNFKTEDVTLFCSFSSNENMSYVILVVFLYYLISNTFSCETPCLCKLWTLSWILRFLSSFNVKTDCSWNLSGNCLCKRRKKSVFLLVSQSGNINSLLQYLVCITILLVMLNFSHMYLNCKAEVLL